VPPKQGSGTAVDSLQAKAPGHIKQSGRAVPPWLERYLQTNNTTKTSASPTSNRSCYVRTCQQGKDWGRMHQQGNSGQEDTDTHESLRRPPNHTSTPQDIRYSHPDQWRLPGHCIDQQDRALPPFGLNNSVLWSTGWAWDYQVDNDSPVFVIPTTVATTAGNNNNTANRAASQLTYWRTRSASACRNGTQCRRKRGVLTKYWLIASRRTVRSSRARFCDVK
jgi:hypothetical protein